MALHLFATLSLLPFFLFSTSFSYDPKVISSWCNQTPHPKICEYYLTHMPNKYPLKKKSDFLKLSIELALENAIYAQNDTYSLGPKCRNKLDIAAWDDCLQLYQYTVSQIKKTAYPNIKCSSADKQTWLSTALTNLETCRNGCFELGVSDYMLPLMSNNVSELISNSLALNGASYSGEPTYKDAYPNWVNPRDRKLLQASTPAANVVVAADGSGDYKTIAEAISSASGSRRYVIHVKAGIYKEYLSVSKENIMLIGDGIGKTVITGSKSMGEGYTTFNSATVAVMGDRFIARGITFRNTAGAANHQAVALRSGSDLSVFYQCSFEGFQDTLYVHSERQFYRESNIYGTVDFIFGNAAVVFQKCNIYCRNPPNKTNTVTANARSDPNQNTGIIVQDSRVTATSDVGSSVKSYLGRPWREYSRTVFMETYLGSEISPAGWMEWDGNFALRTLYYAEYANTGPGSSTANRVTWSGYHVLTSGSQATPFTVGNFLAGNSWLPDSGVPYTPGL